MAERNTELADFLRRARGQCDPSRAGLPADGRVRRVPGLRREEVAFLAGVSTDYYARLEQGRRIVPSPSVADAIGRALGLDEAGRAHLAALIGLDATPPRLRSRPVQRVRPGLYQLLDALGDVPVLVLGRRADVLAQNRMAKALFTDFERFPARERNYARWMLLDGEARSLFVDWEEQARTAVENLRLEAGNDPADRATAELIAQLRESSAEFVTWWDEHRVNQRTHGSKRLRHPEVGDLTVEYETLTLPGDADTTLYAYSAEPGSPSARALSLLASWALTGQDASRS
ncbi:helix-turn-helix transcriptional regulator [Myceligenerans pegani]|uniref:Helix-turn-helix domain-containing protein n=1 Tax=Myceligenerans pegani TaxID=2776917 RepID=A0ABR9N448_9MICO|nr:helix-turn-helix transcriptional regulator [Myceligenerans sp. TRM 65318]MBE1878446.1 helix-turn-helix domain-containing protein [Myceligenerans sp. TRM 65318]MBE3020717.1 helix-turn-helix domain-containing protein [Myceligenerans sp. TRM 65318]